MLATLHQALTERHTAKETELWRLGKGGRELRCVAVYVTTGIDLRLLENEEIQRTELFRIGTVLLGRAREWKRALEESGWAQLSTHPVVERSSAGF